MICANLYASLLPAATLTSRGGPCCFLHFGARLLLDRPLVLSSINKATVHILPQNRRKIPGEHWKQRLKAKFSVLGVTFIPPKFRPTNIAKLAVDRRRKRKRPNHRLQNTYDSHK